ncbi:unnamed protein product [Haemonchus placei]|uniref:BTB domain-containing protein n=1 Tax=Haemonchus placei TaxID=6290 RepID=A0A0N4WD55_HAEPC|nr:unnamed protein product [Haemonchus placei]
MSSEREGEICSNEMGSQPILFISDLKQVVGKQYSVPLGRKNDAFVAETLIPLNLLKKIIEHLPTLAMRVQLTIPSSYFNIERLINLNLEQLPTKPSAQKILTIILNGGKPPGHDWVITVAEGSPREFFVHRKVLEDAKRCKQVVIHTHTSLPSEQLLMVSHEDRCILTATHASDMKTILTYFYLRQYEIPSYDTFARVGRTLCLLFPQEVILGFFEHWEVAIARDLLQKNPSILIHSEFMGTVCYAPPTRHPFRIVVA